MQEEEAHLLYQKFQRVDAAAKQKQGLGFGLSSSTQHALESSSKSAGWEAPYKLADKFPQKPETTSRKRSRSPQDRQHRSEKPHRSRSSLSSERCSHRGGDTRQKGRSRHSDSRQSARHQSHKEQRDERREPSRHTRRRASGSPDRYDCSRHDRSSMQTGSKQDLAEQNTRGRHHSSTDEQRSHHSSKGKVLRDGHSSRSSHTTGRNMQHTKASKAPDYANLIVGYKYMSDANQLKAVTAYKLSKTSAKDELHSDDKPWTRFVFNTQALLEEEGATPDQGSGAPVGLGAFDFRTHRSAQIGKLGEDAHEAAIFGAPTTKPDAKPSEQGQPSDCADSDPEDLPQVVEFDELQSHHPPEANADAANAQQLDNGDSTTAGAPKLSWRERALLKKQQQQQAGA